MWLQVYNIPTLYKDPNVSCGQISLCTSATGLSSSGAILQLVVKLLKMYVIITSVKRQDISAIHLDASARRATLGCR